MAHTVSRLDQILRLDDCILLTHLRMGVQFDTLLIRQILSFLRSIRYIEALNSRVDLTVKLTVSERRAYADITALSEFIVQE